MSGKPAVFQAGFAPFAIPLLLLALLFDLVVRRLFSVLRRPGAPDVLREIAAGAEAIGPFAANLLLLVAGFVLVTFLPALVGRGRSTRLGKTMAMLGLGLLGLAVLRAAIGGSGWTAAQHLVLATSFWLAGVALVRAGPRPGELRIPLGVLLIIVGLPLVWRAIFEWTGGHTRSDSLLETLREACEWLVLLELAMLILPLTLAGRRRALIVALLVAALIGLAAWAKPDALREVLATCFGLWVGGDARVLEVLLTTVGLGAIAGWVALALTRGRHLGAAATLLVLALSGFTPIANAQVLAAWCAAALALRWSSLAREGRDELRRALDDGHPRDAPGPRHHDSKSASPSSL